MTRPLHGPAHHPAALGLALLLAVFTAPLVVAAQGLPRARPEEVGLDPAGLARVGDLVRAAVAEAHVAGAVVGVARDGRVAYLEAVGLADRERGAAMSEGSIFRIYSMTKAVTAVAAMILHEEGRFELDDPISRWLPELADMTVLQPDGSTRPPARPITVRDLMLHTSGLSHRTSPEYRDARVRSRAYTLPRMIENISRVPLREDPGTRFRYSAAPTVLGRLIEIWSGQPLDVFMTERIFTPLGMIDTGFQVPAGDRSRLTVVYASTDGGAPRPFEIEEVPFTERPALLEGSVGLVSTVPDFLRFAQMLVNGGELDGVRILAAETTEQMTGNGLPPAVLAGRRTGWGLANVSVVVDAEAVGGGARVGEYRWDGSAGTEFWVDPGSGTVVVTMWQQQPANPGRLREGIVSQVRSSLRN